MSVPSIDTKNETQNDDALPADFERAIEVAGFGIFNIFLLLVAMLAVSATVFEMSTVSYIMASAECDLELSLLDKGLLNAITYAGMITSAIAWGYFADTRGRKKLLVLGLLIDSLCVLGGALSQNYVQLMVFKYVGGFVICGPFAVLMSYLTELHAKQYRARIMLLSGFMFTSASLILPILALAILPNSWKFQILGLRVHSWQIFMAISAIPSFLGGLLLMLFPESPKFLMSQGRNEEAMQAFQMIYAMNKHKLKNTYPIKFLAEEVPMQKVTTTSDAELELSNDNTTNILKKGLSQLRPMFAKPYLLLSLQVYVMNFGVLLGQNTVRLWLPQLFASIAEFEQKSLGATIMCAILEYSVNKTNILESRDDFSKCEVIITADSYFNNIIVGVSGLCGYLLAGAIVNVIGSKTILNFALALAGTCSISLYWSSSTLSTLIISAVFVNMGSIAATSVINATANLFPTSMRTMILSLTMMFGRTGSLLGNILFPTFIKLGCIPPFLMISLMMFSACILSIFLPNPNKDALK